MTASHAESGLLQERASPHTVRPALTTTRPTARATKMLVTVPQPIPGRHDPAGSGDTTGAPADARIDSSELVAADQYVLGRPRDTVGPTALVTTVPRSASVSSTVAAPPDGGTLADPPTTMGDPAGIPGDSADGEPGAGDGGDPDDDPGPALLQATARLVTVTRTATSLAMRPVKCRSAVRRDDLAGAGVARTG